MKSFDRGNQLLATGLAALAGFVDATGFIATGGFFLSFMSGNSTRLGVGLMTSSADAGLAASLIGAIVAGVISGTLLGRAAGRHHRPAVLLGLGLVLALAAGLAGAGHLLVGLLATSFAMGAENTVFEADGEVRISLTYMTGNLVKVGQRLAGVLLGRGRWEWLPFLALWVAMVGGAVAGAALAPMLGLAGLWVAAGAAITLSLASWLIEGAG
jgi:uncharacterized membrane protein YoaK (UPF0700 family)